MRLSAIWTEAMRNIASGAAHAGVMFLAVLLSGVVLGGYEASNVIGLEQEAASRIGAEADVKTIAGGPVDGLACDRLSENVNGPQQSGALREGPQITLTSTPGHDVSSYEITPGLLALIAAGGDGTDTEVDADGVWVSASLADDFGLVTGSRLETESGDTTVAGVYDWPNDGRDSRLAYAVLTVAPPTGGTYAECWAKQWPVTDQTDGLLYTTVISTGTASMAAVLQLNKGFDAHYDAQAAYGSRLTRWTPWLGLLIGMVLGVISVRRRRLEYAGALHCGESKGAQLLGIAVETATWAGLATVSSCSLLAAVCVRLSWDPTAVAAAAMRTPLAIGAGVLFAALLAGVTIRESQLFRYFKHR